MSRAAPFRGALKSSFLLGMRIYLQLMSFNSRRTSPRRSLVSTSELLLANTFRQPNSLSVIVDALFYGHKLGTCDAVPAERGEYAQRPNDEILVPRSISATTRRKCFMTK
jgi:hypothetical protein